MSKVSNSDTVINDIVLRMMATRRMSRCRRTSSRISSNEPAKSAFHFVKIIVSGCEFKTQEETLKKYPNTLLGSDGKDRFWDDERRAYIFKNHCRRSFESILFYYQSNDGLLSQPRNVGLEFFKEEVKFFKLPMDGLRVALVINGHHSWVYAKHSIKQPADEMAEDQRNGTADSPFDKRFTKLYSIMYDEGFVFYKLIMIADMCATTLFIICHVVSTIRVDNSLLNEHIVSDMYIYMVEGSCVAWIIAHYTAGLLVSTHRWSYVISFMPLVDSIVVLAFGFDLIMYLSGLPYMRRKVPLRALGVLRLFNLARHSTLLYCLGLALKQSFSDLMHVLFVIIFIIFLAAGFVYFIEGPECQPDPAGVDAGPGVCDYNTTKYTNVFASSYWAAVTITTVGYGDMVPLTTMGKICGSALALIGLPLIAIPMPLIMSKFDRLYKTVKEERSEKRRHARKKASVLFSEEAIELLRDDTMKSNGRVRPWPSNTDIGDIFVSETESDAQLRHAFSDSCLVSPPIRNYLLITEDPLELSRVKSPAERSALTWEENWRSVHNREPCGTCHDVSCTLDDCKNNQRVASSNL